MNFKKLGLVLAVSAAATTANAAYDATGENGELILNVWNSATFTSFSLDLNVFAKDAPLADEELVFNIDSSALAHVGGSSASLLWNVAGISTKPAAQWASIEDVNNSGVYMTGTSMPGTFSAATLGTAENAMNTLATNVLSNATVSGDYYLASGESTYAGNNNNFGDLAGVMSSIWSAGTSTTAGQSLYAYKSGPAFEGAVVDTVYQSAGVWTFDAAASTLTYASAVPVPAAVWMFASGLLGMAGVARRNKKA